MDSSLTQEIYALHASLCKALADPKRLLIIQALRDNPITVGELADELGLSQSNVSQHLAILRDRGVVAAERVGNNVYYSLTNRKILQAIDILREVMAEQLAGQSKLHEAALSS